MASFEEAYVAAVRARNKARADQLLDEHVRGPEDLRRLLEHLADRYGYTADELYERLHHFLARKGPLH